MRNDEYLTVNVCTAFKPKRTCVWNDCVDKLCVQPGPRWRRLQQWAARWLVRMGAKNLRSVQSNSIITWKQIPTYPLVEQIRKQREVCELLWRGKLDRVVVGHDVMGKLLREMMLLMPFSFEAEMHMAFGVERRIFDLRIQYVPWMTGILVLPKER